MQGKKHMLNPWQNHGSKEMVNHTDSGEVRTAVLLLQPIRFIPQSEFTLVPIEDEMWCEQTKNFTFTENISKQVHGIGKCIEEIMKNSTLIVIASFAGYN